MVPSPAVPGTGAASMRWLLLGTMALWGANLSVVKLLVARHDTLGISALRLGVAALGLLAVFAWQRHGLQRASDDLAAARATPMGMRRLALLGACAVLMVYLNQICFTEGVARTTAANAALIIALNPLVSALSAALLLHERLTAPRLAGVALGFGGVALVVLNRPGAVLGTGGLGDLLVFASVLSWVLGGVLLQRAKLAPIEASALIYGLGALLMAAHMGLRTEPFRVHWDRFGLTDAALVVLSGLLAISVGALVWNRALATLGVARTALYVYWVPIFGVGFAVLLLGEPLTAWHLAGLAAVLTGTWLGTRGH